MVLSEHNHLSLRGIFEPKEQWSINPAVQVTRCVLGYLDVCENIASYYIIRRKNDALKILFIYIKKNLEAP